MRILGTSPDSIDLAEDRERFSKLLWDLGIPQPASGHGDLARRGARGRRRASAIPVVVRPSYVLGGRGDGHRLRPGRARSLHDHRRGRVAGAARSWSTGSSRTPSSWTSTRVADATGAVVIGGIMEHIEEAGIHSGDSSCVVPPYLVRRAAPRRRSATTRGASPGRSKRGRPDERAVRHQGRHRLRARGEPARVAHGAVPVEGDRRAAGEGGGARDARPDAGRAGPDRGPDGRRRVREDAGVPVHPVPGRRHDPRARDEVDRRGDGRRVDASAWRSRRRRWAPGSSCRSEGTAFISVNNDDKPNVARRCARGLAELGFTIVATRGTAAYLRAHGLDGRRGLQGQRGPAERRRPDPQRRDRSWSSTRRSGRESFFDDRTVRRAAMLHGVPCITTLTGAAAAVAAIRRAARAGLDVRAAAGLPREGVGRAPAAAGPGAATPESAASRSGALRRGTALQRCVAATPWRARPGPQFPHIRCARHAASSAMNSARSADQAGTHARAPCTPLAPSACVPGLVVPVSAARFSGLRCPRLRRSALVSPTC